MMNNFENGSFEGLFAKMMGGSSIPEPAIEPGVTDIIPDDEIENTVAKVVEKLKYAESETSVLRDKWKEIYKAYKTERAFTQAKGHKAPESRVRTPTMAVYIDRLVQQLTLRLVQVEDNFIEAYTSPTKERAYDVENFLWDMYKENQYPLEIIKAAQSAALYGIGFTKVVPVLSNIEPDFKLRHIPNKDFFLDPDASKIEDCTFIIERLYKDFDSMITDYNAGAYNMHKEFQRMMEENNPRGKEVKLKVHSLQAENIPGVGADISNDGRRVFPSSWSYGAAGAENESSEKTDRFIVHEYHDREFILTIVNEKYLIKVRRSLNFYPYQAWLLRTDPNGSMFPKSHGEFIIPLQEEIDIKRNQRIANINLQNDPPVLYTKMAVENVNDFVWKSGAKIEVNNLDGIKWWMPSDISQVNLQEINMCKEEIQSITGVLGVILGQAAKGEKMTRGESANIYTQAQLPFDYASSLMSITGLIPMFKSILKMCSTVFKGIPAQASTAPQSPGNVVVIQPQRLGGKFDIQVSVNPNKVEKDKQNAAAFLGSFSQSPYVMQTVLLRWVAPRLASDYPRDMIKDEPTGQIPMGPPLQTDNNNLQK